MKAYLQYLIWMMLFVIVIEMFFPDSSYKKYLKLILGCILIYTMLSPVIKFVRIGGSDYTAYVAHYEDLLLAENIGSKAYEENYEAQQEGLQEAYETSMKAYIEKQMPVTVTQLFLDWDENELEGIDVSISKIAEQSGQIEVGGKSGTVYGSEAALKNKLKTCLSDFYHVQVENIHITVQKN